MNEAFAVVLAVQESFGVPFQAILGRRRSERLASARSATYWILRMGYDLSYPAIGAMMQRHHTTIMEACMTASREFWTDAAFETRVLDAIARLDLPADGMRFSKRQPIPSLSCLDAGASVLSFGRVGASPGDGSDLRRPFYSAPVPTRNRAADASSKRRIGRGISR